MHISRLFCIFAAALALAGCANGEGIGSVAGGECKIFERPPYRVLGKTQYDQNVADGYTETGVAGCGWKRPAARPPSLDLPKAAARAAAAQAPVKKRTLFRRLLRRPAQAGVVTPAPRVPVAQVPATPAFAPEPRGAPLPAIEVVPEAPAPPVAPAPAPARRQTDFDWLFGRQP